jgi:hypothetical protein
MKPGPIAISPGADLRLRVAARRPPDNGGGDSNGGGTPPPVTVPDVVYLLRIPQFLPNGLDLV